MTPEQALLIFDESTADDTFIANRRTHAEIVALIRRLHELIHPKPKGKKAAKREPTKR